MASSQGLNGTAEPATADEKLNVVDSEVAKEASQVPDGVGKGQSDDGLVLPPGNSGAGLFSRVIIFGIIVGVVAILVKRRSRTADGLTEKSLA